MTIELGIVMDPIGAITVKKDSSLAMLLAAQARGWNLHYMELGDLFMHDGRTHARVQDVTVRDQESDWYTLSNPRTIALHDLDVVLMRKDPPFDMEFVYATYFLERAEADGVLVVNRPRSLRDANEKLFTAWFAQCTPPTLVTRRYAEMDAFLAEHQDIIVKPPDGMGGASIFRVKSGDPNTRVIFETLTGHEQRFALAQRYVPRSRPATNAC